MKKLKGNMIAISVVYLLLGGVLLCWPQYVLNAICYVVGGLVMLSGVVQLVRYFTAREALFFAPVTLVLGLVCLALGLFLALRSDIVQTVLPVVFGLFVVFDSVLRVQNALELRRCHYTNWWSQLALAALSVVLGLVMMLNPFGAINTLVMAIGVILLLEGVLNLISTLYTGMAVRSYQKNSPAVRAAEAAAGVDLDGDGLVAGQPIEGTAVEVEGGGDTPD